jgi:hypothetical protein
MIDAVDGNGHGPVVGVHTAVARGVVPDEYSSGPWRCVRVGLTLAGPADGTADRPEHPRIDVDAFRPRTHPVLRVRTPQALYVALRAVRCDGGSVRCGASSRATSTAWPWTSVRAISSCYRRMRLNPPGQPTRIEGRDGRRVVRKGVMPHDEQCQFKAGTGRGECL